MAFNIKWQTQDESINQANVLLQLGNGPPTASTSYGVNPFASLTPSSTAGHQQASPASAIQNRAEEEGLLHTHEHRRKFVGASSNQALIKWLDQDSSSRKLAGFFPFGVSSAEEFTWDGMDLPWEILPPEPQLSQYVDSYFRHVHPFLPCLDEIMVRSFFRVQALAPRLPPVGPESPPPLFYLVVSIGAHYVESNDRLSDVYERYLRYAWRAIPSLLARPYHTAVQSYILLIWALRMRNKEGVAWSLTGQAVRIAQSLGLHLQYDPSNGSLDARIWWCLYTVDKLLSFEVGRPSAINDADCSVPIDAVYDCPNIATTFDIRPFVAFATLAQQMSRISSELFSRSILSLSEKDRIRKMAECDARLVQWAASLPPETRPTGEAPPNGPNFGMISTVHMLYYGTMITLHRLSLFDTTGAIISCLADPVFQPYISRMSASRSICVSSARSILCILDGLQKTTPVCRLWTLHTVLTAVFVLAIQTYKQPASWQANSDLSLLKPACEFTERQFAVCGFHPKFVELLPNIIQKVEAKIKDPHLASRMPTRPGTPEESHFGIGQDGFGYPQQQSGGTSDDTSNIFLQTGDDEANSMASLTAFSPWLFGDGNHFYTQSGYGATLADMFGSTDNELFPHVN